MKEILKVFLAFILTLFGATANISAAEFPDIKAGEEFYEAIMYASENNIVNGFSDGEFKAYDGITRAELTKILINYKYNHEDISNCDLNENKFPDVSNNYVHAKYICIAKKNSIINGFSDGKFRPEQKITTPEGIKIISNTYNLTSGNSENFDKYFLALEAMNALPDAVKWWPEELWRGETMEILYRLEENLIDRESISYKDYKTHQEWKEVTIEEAGIRLSVPSWMGEHTFNTESGLNTEFISKYEINDFSPPYLFPYLTFTVDYDNSYSDKNTNQFYIDVNNTGWWCEYYFTDSSDRYKSKRNSYYAPPGDMCPELASIVEGKRNIEIKHSIYKTIPKQNSAKFKFIIKTIINSIEFF